MQHDSTGIWLGVGAYVFWGLSPIFWNLVSGVGPLELLSHRVVWAIPILVTILAVRGTLGTLRRTYRVPRTVGLAVAGAVALTANWGIFLWAVLNEHIVDVSLGYFINPLVSVALGVVVLGERLRPAQRFAVGTAAIGVIGMTVLLGVVPWISLVLAFAFGVYGLLKKLDGAAPALQGLLGEVVIVGVPLGVYLLTLGGDGVITRSVPTALWLIGAGFATVLPLWMFGVGVQRIPLSTMGLLQYLAPTLQLIIGIALYGETVTAGELFGFVLVWIALAVFARDQLAQRARPVIASA